MPAGNRKTDRWDSTRKPAAPVCFRIRDRVGQKSGCPINLEPLRVIWVISSNEGLINETSSLPPGLITRKNSASATL